MISRDRGAPPAEEPAEESAGPAAAEPLEAPAAQEPAPAPARRGRPRAALWGAGVAGTAILILGAHALSSRSTPRAPGRPSAPTRDTTRGGAPSSLVGPPSPEVPAPDG